MSVELEVEKKVRPTPNPSPSPSPPLTLTPTLARTPTPTPTLPRSWPRRRPTARKCSSSRRKEWLTSMCFLCSPGSAAPHWVLKTCRRSIRVPLGHGVPSSFPSQQSSPDAGATARKNCALCSVSAYRTKAAQCACLRRLRIPHLCPMRDLVCVSSALHRLDARSRHTRCTAALAGQAGGAR